MKIHIMTTTPSSEVPISSLTGEGRPPDPMAHAWVHDLPHSDKMTKQVGNNVKLNAKLHEVHVEDHPDGKKMSLHFHIHGVQGLGDSLKQDNAKGSKEADLDHAMKSVNL